MKGEKNQRRKVSLSKISFRKVLIVIFVLFIVIVSGRKTIDNYRLKRNGVCSTAVVVSKKRVGSKGVIYTYYEYRVDGVKYEDYSSSDDAVAVGDSIVIIYLESDPSISRSNSFLKIACSR